MKTRTVTIVAIAAASRIMCFSWSCCPPRRRSTLVASWEWRNIMVTPVRSRVVGSKTSIFMCAVIGLHQDLAYGKNGYEHVRQRVWFFG